MTTFIQTAPVARKSISFRPIQWIMKMSQAYRQKQQLKNTENCHLKDMGITREQANDISVNDLVFGPKFGTRSELDGR